MEKISDVESSLRLVTVDAGEESATDISPATQPRRGGRLLGRLLRRLVVVIAMCLAIVVVSFLLVRLIPGDPAVSLLGVQATPEQIAAVNAELGLDEPLRQQFVDHVSNLAKGDLGSSFVSGLPVADIVAERLPRTLALAGISLVLVLVISIPFGIAAAAMTSFGRRPKLDAGFAATTGLLGSVPEYIVATLLVAVFGVWWQVLPVAGNGTPAHLVLPSLAIAVPGSMYLTRLVRAEAMEAFASDYVRTARSKRMPGARLYLRHVLPNVLTSVLSISGLLFANLVGGTIVVENVFSWPGLGSALVKAVSASDYPVIQGGILVIGLVVVLGNGLVEALLVAIDPRRRR